MPRHFTHYYFSNKLTENVSYAISSIIKLYPDAYLLGVLGTDVIKGTGHSEKLESMSPLQLIDVTARHIFTNGSKCQLAYMLGYVCHYALDKAANPYIYHFAANGVAGYFGGEVETHSCEDIAIGIDRHIIRDYLGTAKAVELMDNMSLRKEVVEEIAELYSDIINDVADITYSHHKMVSAIKEARLDMPLSEGIGRVDYMNREHRVWKTVIRGEQECRLSFDELLTAEIANAKRLVETYMLLARSGKETPEQEFGMTNQGYSVPAV